MAKKVNKGLLMLVKWYILGYRVANLALPSIRMVQEVCRMNSSSKARNYIIRTGIVEYKDGRLLVTDREPFLELLNEYENTN